MASFANTDSVPSASKLWAIALTIHLRTMKMAESKKHGCSDGDLLRALRDRPKFDSVYRGYNKKNGVLWRLFDEYDVLRTLSPNKPSRVSPRQLYNHVYSVTGEWETLSIAGKAERMVKCYPKPQNSKEGNATGPLSAGSKLAWFLAPTKWTMFDSKVCTALGEKDFRRFYCTLQRLGFDEWCNAAQCVMPNPGETWFPERVFDKALWWLGKEPKPAYSPTNEELCMGNRLAQLEQSQDLQHYLRFRCLIS